ncbi:MAG: ABC transporter permease, partial [Candidatus Dormibacteria bacterium]
MTTVTIPGEGSLPSLIEPSGRGWWRRFSRRPPAVIGLAGVVIVVAVAVFAPLLAHYSPIVSQFGHVLEGPFSAGHILGTDQLGRDELSRLIYGSQTTLEVGVLATLLAMAVAVPIGIASGFYRGAVDMLAMRITDVV